MSAKHTPWPWEAHIAPEQHRAVVRQGMTPIAEMWMTGQPFAERWANARLIAAAPELLEALQSLMAWASEIAGDNCDEQAAAAEAASVELARAAIAKATGGQP